MGGGEARSQEHGRLLAIKGQSLASYPKDGRRSARNIASAQPGHTIPFKGVAHSTNKLKRHFRILKVQLFLPVLGNGIYSYKKTPQTSQLGINMQFSGCQDDKSNKKKNLHLPTLFLLLHK